MVFSILNRNPQTASDSPTTRITMKKLLYLFLSLSLGLTCLAESKIVSGLTTSSVSTIIIPGGNNKLLSITISNASTGNQVNLTYDGGTANGLGGTDPTTGLTGNGMWLPAGQSVTFYGPYFVGIPIRAIMATGTTTITITTNAPSGTSSFPTN